jgi:hypothetical protein
MISAFGLFIILLAVLAPDVLMFPFYIAFAMVGGVIDWICRLFGWVTPYPPPDDKKPTDKE